MSKDMLDFIFMDEPKIRSKMEVFLWWESKRLRYNIICFSGGIISLIILQIIFRLDWNNLSEFILPVFVIALLGNLFYFLGFLIEIFTPRNEKTGPILFNIGTIFSLFVLFSPVFLVFYFSLWPLD